MKYLILTFVISLAFSSVSSADCVFIKGMEVESINRSDFSLVGTVKSVDINNRAQVEVIGLLKNATSQKISVGDLLTIDGGPIGLIGVALSTEMTYILTGNELEDGILHASGCEFSGTILF